MKRKFFPLSGIMLLAAFVIVLFQSCNKKEDKQNMETITIMKEKQLLNIQFANLQYSLQDGMVKNNQGISGTKTGAYAISSVIEIIGFKEKIPFISVYGTWGGKSVVEENIHIEINSSVNGTDWKGWLPFAANKDAEDIVSTRQTFNNVELDADVRFVKLRVTFKSIATVLEHAELYFFNPSVTSPEMQAVINKEAESVRAELSLADPQNNGTVSKVNNPAYCSKPTFVSRASWSAKPAKNSPSFTTVNFLIIHHEAGSNTSTDWAARVRSVQNFHMDVNGWSDIGYNYLVDPNGVSYEGRGGGENVIGAHNCGKNAQTMGVCMLGSYTSVRPTPEAEWKLKRIMAWKAKQRGFDVTATGFLVDRNINRMTGHRASCSTSCPGDALWNDLTRMRQNVKDIIAQCN
jgi:hypothetical protein